MSDFPNWLNAVLAIVFTIFVTWKLNLITMPLLVMGIVSSLWFSAKTCIDVFCVLSTYPHFLNVLIFFGLVASGALVFFGWKTKAIGGVLLGVLLGVSAIIAIGYDPEPIEEYQRSIVSKLKKESIENLKAEQAAKYAPEPLPEHLSLEIAKRKAERTAAKVLAASDPATIAYAIVRDSQTGCEYIKVSSGITPRLDSTGKPICK